MGKNKIKVLWFADNSIHSLDILGRFDQTRFEIFLVSFSSKPDNINVKKFIKLKKHGYTGQISAIILNKNSLQKLAEEINPKIIYGSYIIGHAFAAARAKLPGQKLVVSALGSDILKPRKVKFFYNMVRNFVLKKADIIHTVSKQLKENVICLDYSPDKIREFPIGVIGDFSKPVNKEIKLPIIFYTNRWHREHYDNITILKAIKILYDKGDREFKLIMAGSGPETNSLKIFVTKNNLSDYVQFVGKVDSEKNMEYMRSSHVYLSASFSDGTSRSLLEAMASGSFPIVSEIEANLPWIRDGCGLLFKPQSENDIYEKIQIYLRNEHNLDYVISNYTKVQNKGLIKHTITNLENIFLELAN